METLSSWIWNPVLSLIYLEIGLVFLVVTRGAAWRGLVDGVRAVWAKRNQVVPGAAEHHVTHGQAFLAALASSVGVGNLAGVGTAIHLGGPGALFWMWVSAVLGMSFRMSSAYFAVKIARRGDQPDLFATPMIYMATLLGKPWHRMAWILAALTIVKGMVTANLIQANSVAHAISGEIGLNNIFIAALLSALVALVIVGGFRSVMRFSVAATPWMLVAYLGIAWLILAGQPGETIAALGSVFAHAFSPYSVVGGVAGYGVLQAMQFGISRGIFSHGSGIGIAPYWQGANTDHPSHGAFMAACVPVVDTLVICTTTALVVLTAGHWMNETGAFLTVSSFQHFLGGGGRLAVTLCLAVFAFTTIINWAHFSERCFQFLGGKNVRRYRWVFAGVTFVGPFLPLTQLWALGDVLIGLMLITHMLPLTYIVIRHSNALLADLIPNR